MCRFNQGNLQNYEQCVELLLSVFEAGIWRSFKVKVACSHDCKNYSHCIHGSNVLIRLAIYSHSTTMLHIIAH